ncbi:MAG: hypothetical protein Q9162_007715 [Coniocarpon cinnabarinum]
MPARLENNRATKILDDAVAGKYAVPAMCCYNAEGIIGCVRAAEAKQAPLMILLFPWAVQYAGGLLVHLAAEAARNAKVPVAVHMDHAQSPEIVKRAADLGGFDSIMCDMSHYEKEENLRLTSELTTYCHERGIATEAEPGRIEGGEDGVAATADLEGLLTAPEEARRFVDTGIDWLAPAFGNVHGSYGERGIQLEYDRLDKINAEVGNEVRIVLHGADPFTKDIFQRCVRHGVSKINLNKIVNGPYTQVQSEKAGKIPLTSVIEEATNKIQASVEEAIEKLGAAGRSR